MKNRTVVLILTLLVFRCLAYGGEIHDAARAGDAERVNALLKSYPSLVNSKMKGGITPLHAAVFQGHESVIKVLLAHKVDVNEGDIAGTTPLHQTLLAATENPAIAELLLANGADANPDVTRREYRGQRQ